MVAGISTACFYPQYTEEALRDILTLRPASVEIFVNSMEEIRPPLLMSMRNMARDSGARVVSLHPFTSGMEPLLFFSKYRRRQEEGRDFYKRYYEAAAALGAKIVVFHGGIRQIPMEDEEYFQRFFAVWEDAQKAGISLCHENVVRCRGYHPEFFRSLRRAIPQAEFVFDVKQAVRAGEDVYQFAEAMGPALRHIHISDHSGDGGSDCLVPGRGVLNIPRLLTTVEKNGFDGAIVVELYRDNFRDLVEIAGGYQLLSAELSTRCKDS